MADENLLPFSDIPPLVKKELEEPPPPRPISEVAAERFEKLAMQEVADQVVRRSQGRAANNAGADHIANFGPAVEPEILARLHQVLNFTPLPEEKDGKRDTRRAADRLNKKETK